MDFENILNTIRPFVVMLTALFVAFLTATWVAAVIWAFRDIRSRTRDIFAQILATLLVFVFFPLFPVPGLILFFLLRPRETLSDIYERSLEEEALLQGIEERMACPSCNRRIEEDFIICPSCHTRLKKGCPSCGRGLHLKWHICPYCGAAQTAASAGLPHAHAVVLPPGQELESRMLAGASPSSLPEPEAYGVDGAWEPIPEDEVGDEPTTVITGFEPDAEYGVDGTLEPIPEDGAGAEPTEVIAPFEPDADADAEPETVITGPEPETEPDGDAGEASEPVLEDGAHVEPAIIVESEPEVEDEEPILEGDAVAEPETGVTDESEPGAEEQLPFDLD